MSGWLVLAHEWDAAAQWAANRLSTNGLDPLTYVTDSDLVGATWHHRVDSTNASTSLALVDGRIIDSCEIRGTLNRLLHIPRQIVTPVSVDDQDYAFQEFSALFLSWLAAFSGPMINPSTPRGLSGAWRTPAEWAMLAAECGLNTAPVFSRCTWDENPCPGTFQAWPPGHHIREDAVVAGTSVFAGHALDSRILDAFRRLAEASDAPLLGVAFDCATCGSNPIIVAVTPLPDLRAGGDELIDAVAQMLTAGESRS